MFGDRFESGVALNVPVLISSCDAYGDAWNPFFALIFRYWPDPRNMLFLISNHKGFIDERVNCIMVGDDRGWASNMSFALQNFIQNDYFIYMQEDYFLTRPVDIERVSRLVALANQHKVACLRLYPSPGPDLPFEPDASVGLISTGASYRVSLQAAIWNRQIFTELLVEGESGWDMEIKGTERSRTIAAPFLSVRDLNDPVITYLHRTAILKGRWTEEAVQHCRIEGIVLDTSKRPVGEPPIPPKKQLQISLFSRILRKLRRVLKI